MAKKLTYHFFFIKYTLNEKIVEILQAVEDFPCWTCIIWQVIGNDNFPHFFVFVFMVQAVLNNMDYGQHPVNINPYPLIDECS